MFSVGLLIKQVLCLLYGSNSYSQELKYKNYKGVVTLHLIPAKVIRVNKIIETPKPGTSYIGEENILIEIDKNFEIMSNWTVVTFKYSEYNNPKTIKYKIFDEEKEITIKYHAVDLKADGDMSSYIKQ